MGILYCGIKVWAGADEVDGYRVDWSMLGEPVCQNDLSNNIVLWQIETEWWSVPIYNEIPDFEIWWGQIAAGFIETRGNHITDVFVLAPDEYSFNTECLKDYSPV